MIKDLQPVTVLTLWISDGFGFISWFYFLSYLRKKNRNSGYITTAK